MEMKKVIKLLKSVGAVKGSRDRSPSSSPERAVSPGSPSSDRAYLSAQYRAINTDYFREMHDSIMERLSGEQDEVISPKAAVKLVRDMKTHKRYQRECGSRILCLDGGGVRGLLQMTILREIERQMKMRIVDLFDWVVGTSTGGIIALALTYGNQELFTCLVACEALATICNQVK